jgi:hypothetical protein
MENLEIFDKSGKALHITDVVYSFIKNVAEENNKDIEDVLVGVDVGVSKEKTIISIMYLFYAYLLNKFSQIINIL